MGLFSYLLLRHFLRINRELSRLQSVNGSPIISHLNETLSGILTIRAFEKQDEFIDKNMEYLNLTINASFWKDASKKWFSTRINLVASTVLFFTTVFCVSYEIYMYIGMSKRRNRFFVLSIGFHQFYILQ